MPSPQDQLGLLRGASLDKIIIDEWTERDLHMNKTDIKKLADLVRVARGDRTLRAFTDELRDGIPTLKLSHQTVSNWEKGTATPDTWTLVTIIVKDDGWKYVLAKHILAITDPKAYDLIMELVHTS